MTKFKLFLIGSAGYSLIEIFWRGYTHWTMSITGGICFCILYFLFVYYSHIPLIMKCVLGCAVITTTELIVGCVVNIFFKWNVWDYSTYSCNILGQICLMYSCLWFLLCIPLSYFIDRISKNAE